MYQVINNEIYYMYDIYKDTTYYIGNREEFIRYLQHFIDYSYGKPSLDTELIAMNFNDKYHVVNFPTDASTLKNKRYIFLDKDYRILNVMEYEKEVLNYKYEYRPKTNHRRRLFGIKHGHCRTSYRGSIRCKRTLAYQNPLEPEYKIKGRKLFNESIWDYIEQSKRIQASWKEQTKYKCQFRGDRKTIRRIEVIDDCI